MRCLRCWAPIGVDPVVLVSQAGTCSYSVIYNIYITCYRCFRCIVIMLSCIICSVPYYNLLGKIVYIRLYLAFLPLCSYVLKI